MPSEFEIIRRYFTYPAPNAVLGVGDDAALVKVAKGMELVVSTDMLVLGTHFSPDTDPYKLGHKALAVNLSDMAAMGATPRWATLAVALPRADIRWIAAFSNGIIKLARELKVDLIGGNTTRGPLNICVTILGEVPAGCALRRDRARVGDDIWVSGRLGDAALALAHLQKHLRLDRKELQACLPALLTPRPRVDLGKKLRGLAHAAIDISDGLLADLGHILERSRVGAVVEFERIPKSHTLIKHIGQKVVMQALIAGGDDYELCFTVPTRCRSELLQLSRKLRLPLTRIGKIRASKGLSLLDGKGMHMKIGAKGFDHFG